MDRQDWVCTMDGQDVPKVLCQHCCFKVQLASESPGPQGLQLEVSDTQLCWSGFLTEKPPHSRRPYGQQGGSAGAWESPDLGASAVSMTYVLCYADTSHKLAVSPLGEEGQPQMSLCKNWTMHRCAQFSAQHSKCRTSGSCFKQQRGRFLLILKNIPSVPFTGSPAWTLCPQARGLLPFSKPWSITITALASVRSLLFLKCYRYTLLGW